MQATRVFFFGQVFCMHRPKRVPPVQLCQFGRYRILHFLFEILHPDFHGQLCERTVYDCVLEPIAV